MENIRSVFLGVNWLLLWTSAEILVYISPPVSLNLFIIENAGESCSRVRERGGSPGKWWPSSAPRGSRATPARSWACPGVDRGRCWCHPRPVSCRATSCSRTTWAPVVSYRPAPCGASCRSWRRPGAFRTRDGSRSCSWWRCRPGRRWSRIWRRQSSSWLSWRRTCESGREKESRSVRGGCDQCPPFMDERPPPEPSSSFSLLFSPFFLTCLPRVRSSLALSNHLVHVLPLSPSCNPRLFPCRPPSLSHTDTHVHTYTRQPQTNRSRTICLISSPIRETERATAKRVLCIRQQSCSLVFWPNVIAESMNSEVSLRIVKIPWVPSESLNELGT